VSAKPLEGGRRGAIESVLPCILCAPAILECQALRASKTEQMDV
jgi:hypothetical protein